MIRTAFQRSLVGLGKLTTRQTNILPTRTLFTSRTKAVKANTLQAFNNSFKSSFTQLQKRTMATASTTTVTKPAVAYWLYFNAGMVFGIVVVGGLTRLTESGLSITEWNVISGMKPPRSELEWIEEFEKYKQFPEYKM